MSPALLTTPPGDDSDDTVTRLITISEGDSVLNQSQIQQKQKTRKGGGKCL